MNTESSSSEKAKRQPKGASKMRKKNNPYPHVRDWELGEIREFFKQRKVKVGNFLAEVEKNRANPHTVTITCEDGRSMNFARIVKTFGVKVDGIRNKILILSDGKIVGGYRFDWMPTLPRFAAGVAKEECSPSSYIETTSFGIARCNDMDEIAESSPISSWVFDKLTEYTRVPLFCPWSPKGFISNSIVDHLRAKCAELSQPDFLITQILKCDTNVFDLPLRSLLSNESKSYGGEKMACMIRDYITNMDLLHMPPPEKWDISLRDILVSRLVGGALEGK